MGRNILSACVRAVDGRNEGTVLLDALKNTEKFCSIQKIMYTLYTEKCDKKEVAALTKLLPPALLQKDKESIKIVQDAAHELFLLSKAVIQKLHLEKEKFSFAGSILEHFDCIKNNLIEQLHEKFPFLTIIEPMHDAVYGAALMAYDLLQNEH